MIKSRKQELQAELAFISAQFGFLPESIVKLQGRNRMFDSMKLLDNGIEKVQVQPYKGRLDLILGKNVRVFPVLSGIIFTLDDLPQNALQFQFAPNLSAEVERLFSRMTALLSPQRLNLNFESLKMHLMVLWNTEFANSNL